MNERDPRPTNRDPQSPDELALQILRQRARRRKRLRHSQKCKTLTNEKKGLTTK